MLTKIGAGQTTFKDFAVDFGDQHIYIGRKGYPKGFFANAVLNIRKDEMAELLRIAAPAFHAFQDMMAGGYSEERFDSARFSVMGLKEKLFKRMPFCLLDLETEQERLDFVFSEEVKVHLRDYWALMHEKGRAGGTSITAEERKLLETGAALDRYLRDLLNFYVYIPMDFSNFGTAVLNLECHHFRDIKKRDEHHYAAACDAFFSDPNLPFLLFASQITPAVAGFTLKPIVKQEFIVLSDPKKKRQKMVARRLHFCRMMDFLVTDFFEGLHAGHAPKQCVICSRFFLTTDARPRKYCTGYAPNDPRKRTCQQVGARMKREDKEKAADHPVRRICATRCNTIDHHVKQGKIDREFALTAKKLARDKRSRALKDNTYFLKQYKQEMSQDSIYAETEKLLGRQSIPAGDRP